LGGALVSGCVVFAALGVIVVAVAALAFGATPAATADAFGKGYWSLIPFTMQMVFVVIGGYVVASAPIVARLIDGWPPCRARARRRGLSSPPVRC
jgi:short subunit fatty acids transporter